MSDLEFLSISEAARLMGVCENTLRDWDIENKFKAIRTIGGHRRYSLTMVREYLEKNIKVEESSSLHTKKDFRLKELLERWDSYLVGIEKEADKKTLVYLLQNASDNCDAMYAPDYPEIFSKNQKLWLTSESWKRSKLKKVVSVQVIFGGPCGMIYWTKKDENYFSICSDAAAAKTRKLNFSYFPDADFDSIKNSYANAIAMEIDVDILSQLGKLRPFNVENFIDSTLMLPDTNYAYDYIVGPKSMLEILSTRKACENIDLIMMPTILDDETFLPLALAGKYPESNLELPIFSPYILVFTAPCLVSGVASALIRYAWFDNKETNNGSNKKKKKMESGDSA